MHDDVDKRWGLTGAPRSPAGRLASLQPDLITREAVRALEVRGALGLAVGGGQDPQLLPGRRAVARRCCTIRRQQGSSGQVQRCSASPAAVPHRPAAAAAIQAELDNGASIAALRRFNDNLANLSAESWGAPGIWCSRT